MGNLLNFNYLNAPLNIKSENRLRIAIKDWTKRKLDNA